MKYEGQKYAIETLVTDTRAYDVTAATEKTITIRHRQRTGETVLAPGYDQGPYPVVNNLTASDPDAPSKRVRLRKDGTYRVFQGGNPLRFTDTEPVERVDYRM